MSEIIGVVLKTLMVLLGVVGVVLVSNSAIQNNKNSNAVSDVSMLASNVQAGMSYGTFTTVSVAAAIAGNAGDTWAPATMISGNTLINPWGGAVTLAVDPANASQFIVTSNAVPNGGCVAMATGLLARAVTINGAAQALPVNASTAKTTCTAANNVLRFTFGH